MLAHYCSPCNLGVSERFPIVMNIPEHTRWIGQCWLHFHGDELLAEGALRLIVKIHRRHLMPTLRGGISMCDEVTWVLSDRYSKWPMSDTSAIALLRPVRSRQAHCSWLPHRGNWLCQSLCFCEWDEAFLAIRLCLHECIAPFLCELCLASACDYATERKPSPNGHSHTKSFAVCPRPWCL